MSNNKDIVTPKQMRQKYNASRTTWYTWLSPIRKKIRPYAKVYTPKEISLIYNLLGKPE